MYVFVLVFSFCASVFCVESESHKRLFCSLGLDRSSDCPVDGSWSRWGSWGSCQGECGQVGRRVRRRTCSNPKPAFSGAPCRGDGMDSEPCQVEGCSVKDYEEIASGDPLRAGQMKVLSLVHEHYPALVDRCLLANCRFQTVQSSVGDGAMEYWNALHCVKHNVGCPVRGGWSPWDRWSPCSAICGEGLRYRNRTCNNPVPSLPQLKCQGESFQTQKCVGMACNPKQDGRWANWQAWSSCSSKCGTGIKKRIRDCVRRKRRRREELGSNFNLAGDIEPPLDPSASGTDWQKAAVLAAAKRLIRALPTGSACVGSGIEANECEMKKCSVDGGWSPWEPWIPCSAQCGVGAQSRSRSCSNPPAQGGGKPCPGPVLEVRRCFKRPCTVKTHQVAMFPGDGHLLYLASGRPMRLLLLFLRFRPLAPSGSLVVRYQPDCLSSTCDYIRLVLEGQFLVLTAQVSGCLAAVIFPEKLELDKWHSVLATVMGTAVTLRVDDAPRHITSRFNCVPILPEMDRPMRVGERFRGQMQRLAINYNPVHLLHIKGSTSYRTGSSPVASNNVGYEIAESDEGFRTLAGKEMIKVPCPKKEEIWKVELSTRPSAIDGILLVMPSESEEDYLLCSLEAGHVKLRLRWGSLRSELTSTEDVVAGRWLLLTLLRGPEEISMSVNGAEKLIAMLPPDLPVPCKGQFYIADAPIETKVSIKKIEAKHTVGNESIVVKNLEGDVGTLAVDDEQVDLSALPAQLETKQFSSQASSIADAYEEVPIKFGEPLDLKCYPGDALTGVKKKSEVIWLRLDEPINETKKERVEEAVYSEEPGMLPIAAGNAYFSIETTEHFAHLKTTSYDSRAAVEGFYGCWIKRSKGSGHLLIGFGVTIIDFTIEFNKVPTHSIMIVAATAVLGVVIALIFCCVKMYQDKDDKFGLYQEVLRMWRCEQLTREEQVVVMLQMVRSPQGQVILGSPEAVQKSEQKILRLLSQPQEVLYSTAASTVDSTTDYDLPPIPSLQTEQQVYYATAHYVKDEATPLLSQDTSDVSSGSQIEKQLYPRQRRISLKQKRKIQNCFDESENYESTNKSYGRTKYYNQHHRLRVDMPSKYLEGNMQLNAESYREKEPVVKQRRAGRDKYVSTARTSGSEQRDHRGNALSKNPRKLQVADYRPKKNKGNLFQSNQTNYYSLIDEPISANIPSLPPPIKFSHLNEFDKNNKSNYPKQRRKTSGGEHSGYKGAGQLEYNNFKRADTQWKDKAGFNDDQQRAVLSQASYFHPNQVYRKAEKKHNFPSLGKISEHHLDIDETANELYDAYE